MITKEITLKCDDCDKISTFHLSKTSWTFGELILQKCCHKKFLSWHKVIGIVDLKKYKVFRKKPVVVAARQLKKKTHVSTLEGTMTGRRGDFLVVGTRGELYIVKEDIFNELYDIVSRETTFL